MNRFREFYTDEDMKLESVCSIHEDEANTWESNTKFRQVKFKSIDARHSFLDDVDYEIGFPF